jgi:hypothetical protein
MQSQEPRAKAKESDQYGGKFDTFASLDNLLSRAIAGERF